MSDVHAHWGGPTKEATPEDLEPCTDPDCESCRLTGEILDAGARVICNAAGGDYDEIHDPHTKAHYRAIAGNVMAAMSGALIETGMVAPTGGVDV